MPKFKNVNKRVIFVKLQELVICFLYKFESKANSGFYVKKLVIQKTPCQWKYFIYWNSILFGHTQIRNNYNFTLAERTFSTITGFILENIQKFHKKISRI